MLPPTWNEPAEDDRRDIGISLDEANRALEQAQARYPHPTRHGKYGEWIAHGVLFDGRRVEFVYTKVEGRVQVQEMELLPWHGSRSV